jgi:hypothetical protein
MTKSTLYATTKVLLGNNIEIHSANFLVGQTVEVIILVPDADPEVTPYLPITEEQSLTIEQRLDFLKLPISERRQILESQAEKMLAHYQQETEWQDLMAGDIIEY